MQFPSKITSSCIWVAIPVDWVIYIGMPVVRTDGGPSVYGHVITKFPGMCRFTYPWSSAIMWTALKGLWKETISCSFKSHVVKFVSNLSGRLSFFLGRSKAESSLSSLDAQEDKKNSRSWHLSWERSAGQGDATDRHVFNRLSVCDYIGLKKVINKMSGLVQNMTLEEFE